MWRLRCSGSPVSPLQCTRDGVPTHARRGRGCIGAGALGLRPGCGVDARQAVASCQSAAAAVRKRVRCNVGAGLGSSDRERGGALETPSQSARGTILAHPRLMSGCLALPCLCWGGCVPSMTTPRDRVHCRCFPDRGGFPVGGADTKSLSTVAKRWRWQHEFVFCSLHAAAARVHFGCLSSGDDAGAGAKGRRTTLRSTFFCCHFSDRSAVCFETSVTMCFAVAISTSADATSSCL